jgi:lipopolysaccharide/colanic/teichoic acid biosynthesis glycosyltransferase
MIKRLFDIFFSLVGIIVATPIILVLAVLIKATSEGPIIYKAPRAGRGNKVFYMYKFRTMVKNADRIGGPSTSANDPRLTAVGGFIRKYKLDELPQFVNILKGEMSFVGPRPEVVSEIDLYDSAIRQSILSVKPGLTDLASIAGLHEEEILRGADDPHRVYREKIQSQKIKLQLEYIQKRTFWLDMKILVKTFLNVVLHK